MRILCLGDSIMQYNDCSTYPCTGWVQELPRFFVRGTEFLNFARNGRSTKSFLSEGRFKNVLEFCRPGDFALIQFGHNDEKSQDPTRFTSPEEGGEFRRNLEFFAVNLLAKKCFPILLSPMARRKFVDSFGSHDEEAKKIISEIRRAQEAGVSSEKDSEKLEHLREKLHELWRRAGEMRSVESTHGDYPKAVIETAKVVGVPAIDMTNLTEVFLEEIGEEKSRHLFMNFGPLEYVNFPEGKDDNSHLRPDGAFEFSRIAAMEIARLGETWADYAPLSAAIVGKAEATQDGAEIDDEYVVFGKTSN